MKITKGNIINLINKEIKRNDTEKARELFLDPYSFAILREALGVDDFYELNTYKNLDIIFTEHNGEKTRSVIKVI